MCCLTFFGFLRVSKFTIPIEGACTTPFVIYHWVLSYLAKRNSRSGPLFITKEGKGCTSAMFRAALKSLLGELKVNKQCYNTHSFCIGAAMCASLSNLSDTHIQLLGCWRSNAFKCYIKPPPSEVRSKILKDLDKAESVTHCTSL